MPHVLQGELARLCSRFQVKSGASTGVIQSNTLLQCSISKELLIIKSYSKEPQSLSTFTKIHISFSVQALSIHKAKKDSS